MGLTEFFTVEPSQSNNAQRGGAMSDHNGESCACGGNCGCGGHDHAQEVYLTREEYVTRLEQYLEELRAEIRSVEAELVELRQAA
jgi:hypothetical protein